MTIDVGDRIPSATFKRFAGGRLEDVSTEDLFAARKVVVFSVPGAFTPTCSSVHLPGYVEKSEEFRGKGVDEVICLSVNDPFVMRAWGQEHGVDGKVTLLPDWDASFTLALGLEMDGSGAGLGVRGKRFSMIVDDGVVKTLDVEDDSGVVVISGANDCLAKI